MYVFVQCFYLLILFAFEDNISDVNFCRQIFMIVSWHLEIVSLSTNDQSESTDHDTCITHLDFNLTIKIVTFFWHLNLLDAQSFWYLTLSDTRLWQLKEREIRKWFILSLIRKVVEYVSRWQNKKMLESDWLINMYQKFESWSKKMILFKNQSSASTICILILVSHFSFYFLIRIQLDFLSK